MDYYIFSYAVDIGQIAKAIGSKDDLLFENIQKEEVFKNYSEQNTDLNLSLEKALYHIIYGEPYRKRSESTYWYALIALCAYYSESLPFFRDIILGRETDLIDDFVKNDFGIDLTTVQLLLDKYPYFNLPQNDGIPMVGIIPPTKMKSVCRMMNRILINDLDIKVLLDHEDRDDDEKAIIYEAIKGVKSNIDFCSERNLSLISFCH
ncbi:DUF7691 family protein [Dysgonomonas macrotermitis]|uniref:DUF7691 domain-containing protein n=1 Tax=Dysgonomonas macrotermitis TaxID=1346286 RepID=A0A1M5BLA3_9BACT|nr:hypothetical protein [Dysgonomonas macrotermitis]SHF43363.1 hypothetical protein SAMN05444362_106113 [Dysgonomonas macrotermitis]